MALKKEIKDLLILLKWSDDVAKSVSEDEIDSKELLSPLSIPHITKLCAITCNPGNGVDNHKVLMIDKDNLILAMYWVQHRIRRS